MQNKMKYKKIIAMFVLTVSAVFLLTGVVKCLHVRTRALQKKADAVAENAGKLLSEGKWPEALNEYKRILGVYPQYAGQAEVKFRIANIYLHRLIDRQEARKYYEEILQEKRRFRDSHRIPDSMVELAGIYRADGKYQEAIDLLEECLGKYAEKINKDWVYSQLFMLYGQIGNKQKMEEMFLKRSGQ